MRVIDAEKVYCSDCEWKDSCKNVVCDVKSMPTIDPESLRPQGVWECEYETWGKMQCSVCKKEALLEKSEGDIRKTLLYVTSNYCPNCGANMKGAGEDA